VILERAEGCSGNWNVIPAPGQFGGKHCNGGESSGVLTLTVCASTPDLLFKKYLNLQYTKKTYLKT
jgi:hypothetical protein